MEKLTNKKAWILCSVRERADVREEATRMCKEINMGSLMALGHKKSAEKLLKPETIYKGRLAFREDCVKDQTGNYGVFAARGTSSSSSLVSAKNVDFTARLPNNSGEDADATSAYTQTELGGAVTCLPNDQRPPEWVQKCKDRFCILRLCLYGHPLAGVHLELYCHGNIQAVGLKKS